VPELQDYSRLCIHTITTKPWSLEKAVAEYQAAGVSGITVWRNVLEPYKRPEEAGRILRDSGLSVVSLCRGGFFPAPTAKGRQEAIDDNLRAIEESAAIGSPLIVLVCGAVPGMPLEEGRKQIADGIAAVLPEAASSGIRLAIEPLHPMYADSRSAINTLGKANDIVGCLNHPSLGVTVDVYHVWWDPDLESEIARAGSRVFSFHVCDWRTLTRDLLNDRGLMGEGCIDIRGIRTMVEKTGFDGFIEVEIFSEEYWATDQTGFVANIKSAYLKHC
jgi:sugar phosphate isomerase/epimerase